LLFYQIKIVVKQYKTDEFVKSMCSFTRRIRKEKKPFTQWLKSGILDLHHHRKPFLTGVTSEP
jgi:hypothetical protein